MVKSVLPAFVPENLNPAEWQQLEPLYQVLLHRHLDTAEELAKWLHDYSELTAAVYEYGWRTQIAKACHTDDAEVDKRFMHWIGEVQPRIKPIAFELQKKYIAAPAHAHRPHEEKANFKVLDREWNADVTLFRQENVELEVEVQKLVSEYDKLQGATIIEFQGTQYTPQQMARFSEETDRSLREAAWRAVEDRRVRDVAALDDIYSKLLKVRTQIAHNAGLSDYRSYIWKGQYRFDYAPAECKAFADAISAKCLPLVREMDRQRCADLKLAKLRPWDGAVDPHQRPPLRPFDPKNTNELVEKTAAIFDRVSSRLGQQFRRLKQGRNLDLESRKGKRPGGFQSNLDQSRETFIFMNAAGLQSDVDTMLHEAGHAFHSMAYYETVPLVFQRGPGAEFCEVASMSMELLGFAHLDVFYAGSRTPDGPQRAKRKHLENIVRLLPWIATIDQFQHWIYTHSGHTEAQRREAWMDIFTRFFDSPHIDWSGLEQMREHRWQRQIHLYHYPFYYIEYGIAQLGALQVWLNYKREPEKTLEKLLHAFSLGNTRPLPELFSAAGLKFEFSAAATLDPLMKELERELAALPA